MHGIATLVAKLRANPDKSGMITANGGWLSKHAVGIYSTTPALGVWQREAPAIGQQTIDAIENPRFTEQPTGDAVVETYTVCFDRNGPVKGIVIGRLTQSNTRFVANTPDDQNLLASLVATEMLSRPGKVTNNSPGSNIFMPN